MGVFLASLGLILNEKNAKYLLAGYNTASEEEQQSFDIKGYLKLFRNFHFFLGGSILIFGLATFYLVDRDWSSFFIGVYPILAYIYLIYRGKSFYKENNERSAKIGIYILLGCLALITVLSYFGFSEDSFIVKEDSIEIEGMYGVELNESEIMEINLLDTLPRIGAKLNGFALSDIYKGHFRAANRKKVRLIINENNPPYIEIITDKYKRIYYSCKGEKTREVYKKLEKEFPALTKSVID